MFQSPPTSYTVDIEADLHAWHAWHGWSEMEVITDLLENFRDLYTSDSPIFHQTTSKVATDATVPYEA